MAVTALLAGCGTGDSNTREGPPDGGSLRVRNHGDFAIAVPVGRISSYGDLIVSNDGGAPVTLKAVKWDPDPAAGIEVVGQLVAGPARMETVGFDYGYPLDVIRNAMAPLAGYTVPRSGPEGATQIIIGLKATRPGRHQLRRIRLHYRVGDERHVLEAPGSLTLCAPRGVRCSAPGS